MPESLVAVEHGRRFALEPLAGGNPGLYLDARSARAWVQSHAVGRRILNLFAWTGGFGVGALAGGARSVLHVDQQKRALARAKANHALNEQRIDDRDFERDDVYRFLTRAAKQGRRFGGIVIDAPPTVPGKAARDARSQDYGALVPLAREVLDDHGWIVCMFSRRDVPRSEYEHGIVSSCPDLTVIDRGESGIDFPEDDPERKLRFSVFSAR